MRTLYDSRPIRPMLSTPGEPFDSDQYLFEPKWDGLRTILYLHERKIELQNRNLRNITQGFPELQSLTSSLDARSLIVDGEVVVLNKKGLPSFQLLQPRFGITDTREARTLSITTPATFVAFDLLHLDGRDMIAKGVEERKDRLRKALHEGPYLLYSDHVPSRGRQFYRLAKKKGFEGVVAKKLGSHYLPGIRSADWIKMKSIETIDCIIVGYTRGEGMRSSTFGSLVLAAFDGEGKLHHIGNVGGGFNDQELETIKARLVKLQRKTPVIQAEVESNTPVTWVKPILVCEAEYGSMTEDRKLRFPRFKRLRADLDPETVRL